MQIILLSGGSGKRLWPLSNGTRSKQFLRLLPAPDGRRESMVQRVVRQLGEADLDAKITVATSESQRDAILAHLGDEVSVVTEPERRDTFPAIALATAYLAKQMRLGDDETVVVMPCDPYTESGYFTTIKRISEEVENGLADLVLMGIRPSEPSAKFGYLVPTKENPAIIDSFSEKPSRERAEELLAMGAVWNGGVFGFRLGYLRDIYERYLQADGFEEFRNRYGELPKISFDYEVAEKAKSVGVVYFDGEWKDLGTWDALSRELPESSIGNVIESGCENTTAINELDIPVVCHGLKDVIVAASPDGILVADKAESESIKDAVGSIDNAARFEECSWGSYRVIDHTDYDDASVTTRILTIKQGQTLRLNTDSDSTLTLLGGSGEIETNGRCTELARGRAILINKGEEARIHAQSKIEILEVIIRSKSAN